MQTQSISFPSGNKALAAYLAYPDGAGPFPTVVVIHEAYGLNENIKDIARRFAGEGYAALAVDLFSDQNRAVCMTRLMAGAFINSLEHQGIKDLRAALTYLESQPFVDKARLGAIGFCLGGGLSIAWACTEDRLKAIAPFYAFNPRPMEAVNRLCPVVGSYPDPDMTTAQGRRLKDILDTTSIPHDIKIYSGAKHSFFNDQSSRTYNPAASADAWQRTLAFFKEHIG